MKILFVGDVVGKVGCDCVARLLPKIKRQHGIDLTVINCENASATNGVMPAAAQSLLHAGADVLTGGNHIFGKKQMHPMLEENERILRPANYPSGVPGHGRVDVDCGAYTITVINLQGTAFMDALDNPFTALDRLLDGAGKIVLVDFHAEATSEKITFAHYVDGRVTAVVGTHTHVQTSDAFILPKGTAYLTDLGMTGPYISSIGRDLKPVTRRFVTGMPSRFDVAEGPCVLEGAVIEFDPSSAKAASIVTLRIRDEIS
jgi:metallophosphoesterase (TIGR00282 family)